MPGWHLFQLELYGFRAGIGIKLNLLLVAGVLTLFFYY